MGSIRRGCDINAGPGTTEDGAPTRRCHPIEQLVTKILPKILRDELVNGVGVGGIGGSGARGDRRIGGSAGKSPSHLRLVAVRPHLRVHASA